MKPTLVEEIILEFLRKVEHLTTEERAVVTMYLSFVSKPVIVNSGEQK